MKFEIEIETLQAVLAYLAKQPWESVNEFIGKLTKLKKIESAPVEVEKSKGVIS